MINDLDKKEAHAVIGLYFGQSRNIGLPPDDEFIVATEIHRIRAAAFKEAADRYCEASCAWPSSEWEHPDQCECALRLAILGGSAPSGPPKPEPIPKFWRVCMDGGGGQC